MDVLHRPATWVHTRIYTEKELNRKKGWSLLLIMRGLFSYQITPRLHQGFLSTSNAYRVTYDCGNMNAKSINEKASELAKHVKVTSRVDELKKEQEEGAERDDSGLTEKQHEFVDSYIKSGCYSDAYREAYDCENMSPKTVNNEAYKLSCNHEITARISKLKARIQAENVRQGFFKSQEL